MFVLGTIGVYVLVGRTFSGSESVFSKFWRLTGFLLDVVISFNICFWFAATILARSDMIKYQLSFVQIFRMNS